MPLAAAGEVQCVLACTCQHAAGRVAPKKRHRLHTQQQQQARSSSHQGQHTRIWNTWSVNRILSHCMYRRRHFVSTTHCIGFLHAHAWLRNCVSKNSLSFHLLFRAMSHDLHFHQHFLSSMSLSSTSPSFTGSGSRLITSRIHCAD